MCGIIGYVGVKSAYPVLRAGLKRLEYRGYDSAGVAVLGSSLLIQKAKGQVDRLPNIQINGNIGIAHTRWATHGVPSEVNAHPHASCDGKIVLAHNGIIENYLELKEELKDHTIRSQTDSEIVVHLIEKYYQGNLLDAVRKASLRCTGTYAFCVLHEQQQELVAGRNGSPLLVGIGDHEYFIASDASGIIEHTNRIVYLDNLEFVRLTLEGVFFFDQHGQEIKKKIVEVNFDAEAIQKSGFAHYMLKEIHDQPTVLKHSMNVTLPNLKKPSRIFLIGCGTAYHAALIGKYLFENLCIIPSIAEVASEFRYKENCFKEGDLVIVISQSGETADTMAALRLAKEKKIPTLGIINVVQSTMAREVDTVIYTIAGPEIGVASTKAFTGQLSILYKLVGHFGGVVPDMRKVPLLMEKLLSNGHAIPDIARKYFTAQDFLFMARGYHYPLALEGALKLKEISYIHAEGYAAGEMKHGPIALITESVPVVVLCLQDALYEKMLSNIQEIKARQGKIIAIATESDTTVRQVADDVIYIPRVDDVLYPLLAVVPLQLLAYHIAKLRDCDIDKPRNLAKSVTVE